MGKKKVTRADIIDLQEHAVTGVLLKIVDLIEDIDHPDDIHTLSMSLKNAVEASSNIAYLTVVGDGHSLDSVEPTIFEEETTNE